MKAKIAVVVFSLLVLVGIGMLMLLEERDFRLVAMAPTATRTPTKTPRPTRTLVPTVTPRAQPTSPPQLPPTPPPAPTSQPTVAVSGTAFTPQPWPTPLPSQSGPGVTATPQPTSSPAPTQRPQPTRTPMPTATLVQLDQFTGEVFWLSTYSPNCGSMGIGKRFSTVVDAQGKPVAGVVIKLWWADANPSEYIYSNPTGDDGAFEIALGVPRDFTVYLAVHSHWGNPVETSETITVQFQAARDKDCLTPADGGTGLGHQWAIVKWTKHW